MTKKRNPWYYVALNKATMDACICTTKAACAQHLNINVATVYRTLGKKDHPKHYIDYLPLQKVIGRHINFKNRGIPWGHSHPKA